MQQLRGGSFDSHQHRGRRRDFAAQIGAQSRRAGPYESGELTVGEAGVSDRLVDAGDHFFTISLGGVVTGAFDGKGKQCAHTVLLAVAEIVLDTAGQPSPWGSAQFGKDRLPVTDQPTVDGGDERPRPNRMS